MKKIIEPFVKVPRTPVLRRPDEYDMVYKGIFFQSMDGTVLEGWYIPAKKKSNKIVMCKQSMMQS